MSPTSDQQRGDPMSAPRELWRHADPKGTQLWAFMREVNRRYGTTFSTYEELYAWSVADEAAFWEEVWEFVGIVVGQGEGGHAGGDDGGVMGEGSGGRAPTYGVAMNAPMFPRPDFFPSARLNFAENLLYSNRSRNISIPASGPAILEANEEGHIAISWSDLRERVRRLSLALRAHGIKSGDRVAGFLGNHASTVVAMLAATSVGALWTGVSPDTGVTAVLDRLVQIEPRILLVDNAVRYNLKTHSSIGKAVEIVSGLKALEHVVVFATVPNADMGLDALGKGEARAWTLEEFLESAPNPGGPLVFEYLPPSHPVYILYSSGTTGKPKCILHSALGTLIQHKKEHILHCDLQTGDRLFYFTTCTWMMWHWLVSALATGATIVLYDGSPFHPHGSWSMPRLIQELQITHFSTSAKYLSVLEQKEIFPHSEGIDLSCLKAIYSTGSPLAPSTFEYVYKAFPPTINLGSITGGTDIVSLFGAPCPLLPVYVGEIQCKGLGMAISAYAPSGQPVPNGEAGDLVCTKPFPCQPVSFFGPDGHAKYRSSYFETFTDVWHHGDFVKFRTDVGGITMLGRSDGILKPAGVRFGSAEIYNVLLARFAAQVQDALCVGRRRETDTDEMVVLFLKMEDGAVCDAAFKEEIRAAVKRDLSARHVPGIIDECFEVPLTTNGKKVEIAVKQILCGMNIKTSASVANADCLDWYKEWARKH